MSPLRHLLVAQAYDTRRSGDRMGALQLYLDAAEALKGPGDTVARASAIRHAADLYMELDQAVDAGQKYKEAWALYQTIDPAPDLDLANCRRPMALWHEVQGQRTEAAVMWREARQWYEKAAVSTGLDMQPAFDECDRHLGALEA